ncbi:hypothetical protein BABINDRAFT_163371 [Babjeviella inositovora NRRL Y-12698]|uniref:GST C-terminal domain-containing protein n=1 Tax=Babjeviella inositovora NRRL Y-12698 TaxID=984486 RepID=A0A1E3QJ69_9ASCO|nr:uncharacterized protein BABINDRAFT_163371 [Babjeviella inositovora NRRL Y-12698]ODQ77658.1 hypothetical protein BABINDRAFT_163371 [Babjeviella inositovora NRRL Y-12698]
MSEKLEIHKFQNEKGEYKRKPSEFRSVISDAANSQFKPEANRYHLYVSYACPWANRTLILRALKGLSAIITVSVVHWHMDDKGWRFPSEGDECKDATEDHVNGVKRLSELYFKAEPGYTGRYTVPVLWDKKLGTIVNNESSEIIRMLNSGFNSVLPTNYAQLDFYPEDLRAKIDELNEWIYPTINNGVYKSGFATNQQVYEREVGTVFKSLDDVEQILKGRHEKKENFLLGNQLTEADIRLFVTIVRFDPVYVQHFKCNIKDIRHDYPHIHKWLRLLYWKVDGIKETVNFEHIKSHYTKSHPQINPFGITPVGPIPNILDFE